MIIITYTVFDRNFKGLPPLPPHTHTKGKSKVQPEILALINSDPNAMPTTAPFGLLLLLFSLAATTTRTVDWRRGSRRRRRPFAVDCAAAAAAAVTVRETNGRGDIVRGRTNAVGAGLPAGPLRWPADDGEPDGRPVRHRVVRGRVSQVLSDRPRVRCWRADLPAAGRRRPREIQRRRRPRGRVPDRVRCGPPAAAGGGRLQATGRAAQV